ncbi:4-(cytidine 5'-diphospho)-2-C-methyl-D-erythritol kinase [Eubacteriales bacterium KG127]
MNTITLASYGKINLSIDVGPVQEDGYHPVDMIMCQILLHDLVKIDITFQDKIGSFVDNDTKLNSPQIKITSNLPYIPRGKTNLCYKSAELFIEEFSKLDQVKSGDKKIPAAILINLQKKVPVGAGLGGGSGNAAAVFHGLNAILGARFSMEKLMDLGGKIGADVPFAIMNQAKSCKSVPAYLRRDRMASVCARARGRGTELEPLRMPPLNILLVKPKFSVSTKEVYQGIDNCSIPERPDNDKLSELLEKLSMGNEIYAMNDSGTHQSLWKDTYSQMINVLENYTAKKNHVLSAIKKNLKEDEKVEAVLMSGSGPTIFAILKDSPQKEAYKLKNKMARRGYESILTEVLDGTMPGMARRKKRDDNKR